MQFKRNLVVFAIIASFLAFAMTVSAADNDPITVTGILKAAGCPLDADQQKVMDDLSEDEGFRAVRTVTQTFTDDQNAALIKVLGEMVMPAGMGGGMGGGGAMGGGQAGGRAMGPRINYLSQVVILEKEGVPLTEKQLADAKKASEEATQGGGMGFGGMMAINDVLNEKQSAAMEKYMGNMGGGMGGFGGGGMGGGMR